MDIDLEGISSDFDIDIDAHIDSLLSTNPDPSRDSDPHPIHIPIPISVPLTTPTTSPNPTPTPIPTSTPTSSHTCLPQIKILLDAHTKNPCALRSKLWQGFDWLLTVLFGSARLHPRLSVLSVDARDECNGTPHVTVLCDEVCIHDGRALRVARRRLMSSLCRTSPLQRAHLSEYARQLTHIMDGHHNNAYVVTAPIIKNEMNQIGTKGIKIIVASAMVVDEFMAVLKNIVVKAFTHRVCLKFDLVFNHLYSFAQQQQQQQQKEMNMYVRPRFLFHVNDNYHHHNSNDHCNYIHNDMRLPGTLQATHVISLCSLRDDIGFDVPFLAHGKHVYSLCSALSARDTALLCAWQNTHAFVIVPSRSGAGAGALVRRVGIVGSRVISYLDGGSGGIEEDDVEEDDGRIESVIDEMKTMSVAEAMQQVCGNDNRQTVTTMEMVEKGITGGQGKDEEIGGNTMTKRVRFHNA